MSRRTVILIVAIVVGLLASFAVFAGVSEGQTSTTVGEPAKSEEVTDLTTSTTSCINMDEGTNTCVDSSTEDEEDDSFLFVFIIVFVIMMPMIILNSGSSSYYGRY